MQKLTKNETRHEVPTTIKEMQNLLYKFCSQFDGDNEPRNWDYLLYNNSDQDWCNIWFDRYAQNYTFGSPSYEVNVTYDDNGEDIRMVIKGDADELFTQLAENFQLLTDSVSNQLEEHYNELIAY